MTTKEEVCKEVMECADTLMILNSSKPTSEECRNIQLWKDNAAKRKIFLRYSRRYKSSTITTPSSSTVMKSTPKRDPKAQIHDGRHFVARTSSSKREHSPKNAKRRTKATYSKTRERTPHWLMRLMRSKNGRDGEGDSKKIIHKSLTATDVHSNNNRLSIPLSQIVELEFLSPEEERFIEEDANRVHKEGVDAILVASDLREFEVNLRLWNMSRPLYNLVTGWNKVVEDCCLKEYDEIRLWSFHSNGQLYFALVPPPPNNDDLPHN